MVYSMALFCYFLPTKGTGEKSIFHTRLDLNSTMPPVSQSITKKESLVGSPLTQVAAGLLLPQMRYTGAASDIPGRSVGSLLPFFFRCQSMFSWGCRHPQMPLLTT
jgi:hypothetical protein